MPLNDLIAQARAGDPAALGELLDQHRDQLRALAESDLGKKLQRRVDASDVVQQTFLIAHRCFEQFRGETDPELIAWLRTILNQNVQEAVRRHVHAQHRTVTQEVSIQSAGTTSLPLDPPAADPTPSQRLARREETLELLTALESLPADQREAVRLKHLDDLSLSEIAAIMSKTEAAVAGLLRRGIAALKQRLRSDS
ncbi:MAG: sigma-70 family RNA polymerase sigma factor [Planctomycetales bacterium]|nr:sigma-70 family RNA polymerase sigma factor [Planctomycetales bacterium]